MKKIASNEYFIPHSTVNAVYKFKCFTNYRHDSPHASQLCLDYPEVDFLWGIELTRFRLGCLSQNKSAPLVEDVCTSTNTFLSNDTKIVFEFQRVDGEVAFTNFVIQKRDGQKTSNCVAPWRRSTSEPYQAWHADRGGSYHACVSETCSRPTQLSPLGTLKIWGKAHSPQLKPQ